MSYLWGKDGGSYNCSAATIPQGAYMEIYASSDGNTTIDVELTHSWYLLSCGFTQWEGYSIDNDPALSVYTSALGLFIDDGNGDQPDDWIPEPIQLGIIIAIAVIVIILVTVVAVKLHQRR